jgi:ketosteroid isomerase-like protein
MTEITDDLPARLLHEEHAGWRALCEGRGAEYYYRVMTRDAVMLVPGRVLDRGTILASLEGLPPWDSYEIHDPRVVRLPAGGGILFYRALAKRGGTAHDIRMSTTYVRQDGGWAIAAHQQTPV